MEALSAFFSSLLWHASESDGLEREPDGPNEPDAPATSFGSSSWGGIPTRSSLLAAATVGLADVTIVPDAIVRLARDVLILYRARDVDARAKHETIVSV